MLIKYLAKTLTIALLSGGMYFYLNPQLSYALPQQNPNLISSLDAAALYARGMQKRKNGDFKGAIADFTEAIRLRSDYEDAYLERYRLKFQLGDKQGAMADINTMIRLKPNYIFYYLFIINQLCWLYFFYLIISINKPVVANFLERVE